MRVVQAVFGVFHHFALARQLERRGHLERIYSTWPWARLRQEGLPRARVETFPWLHTPEYLLRSRGVDSPWLMDRLSYANAVAFDRWMRRRIPPCDAFVAISGAGLATGKVVQERGGVFVCDRGSTHHRYQAELLADEYRRWGVNVAVSDPRDTQREEALYAQADAITVPSSFAAQSFVRLGVAPEKVHVIPYGVDLREFSPGTSQLSTERFEVLCVGGASLRKGTPYLLEAFRALQHPRKRLRIIGQVAAHLGPLLSQLPTSDVEFQPAQSKAEVIAAMRSSHLLVVPSIEEGLALVQAEAMACGCPVLASENSGARDLFTHGVEGLIVPVRDVLGMTECMQALADDPERQKAMREAGLRRVRAMGGWNEYGDRWEALLSQLIMTKQRERPAAKQTKRPEVKQTKHSAP